MVMRSEQSTFPHVRLRESEGSRAKGATHQREEERHDVQRLYPARPDDDVAEGGLTTKKHNIQRRPA